jgi:hypothetical protein
VTKRIVELACPSFDLLKDTFNWISITVRLVPNRHRELKMSGVQPRRSVNEELGVLDRAVLPYFSKNILVNTLVLDK